MFRYISKNKGILILAAIVLASFLWMTSQVREPGGPSLLERGVNTVTYPFAKSVDVVTGAVRGVWEGYFYLVGLVKENERLAEEKDRLYAENTRLREELAGRERLARLLELKQETNYPVMPARVVGRDPTSWFKSAWIDAGANDGVLENMPATQYSGVLGRVMKPFPYSSRVMLITHPASSVSCIIERTRDTGILTGDGTGECRLDYVEKKMDVREGDMVITSGLDRVFPKGMPVGVVTAVKKDAPGYFQEVRVKPTADLDHVEELLIVQYVPEARK